MLDDEELLTEKAGSDAEKSTVSGSGGSEIKGVSFDSLIAQWRKITSFAFALQPISSFSKAVLFILDLMVRVLF